MANRRVKVAEAASRPPHDRSSVAEDPQPAQAASNTAADHAKLGCVSFVGALGVAVLFGRVEGQQASLTMVWIALGVAALVVVMNLARKKSTDKPSER